MIEYIFKSIKKVKEIGVFTEYISSDFDNEKEIEIKDINALRGFLLVVIKFVSIIFELFCIILCDYTKY